jgi:hypothetical protein
MHFMVIRYASVDSTVMNDFLYHPMVFYEITVPML